MDAEMLHLRLKYACNSIVNNQNTLYSLSFKSHFEGFLLPIQFCLLFCGSDKRDVGEFSVSN